MHWWLLGLMMLLVRHVWDLIVPMTPSTCKGVFYVRDVVTLLPAALCLGIAVLHTISRISDWIRPLQRRTFRYVRSSKWTPVLILAGVQTALCLLVSVFVFHTRAHVPDEVNYVFGAKVIASGDLWASPPPVSKEFLKIPYTFITESKWFSIFFPGQSALLALGLPLVAEFLVNPVLSGVLVLVTVWYGYRIFEKRTARIAGILILFCPFALQQGASYFSHIASAILFCFATVPLLAPADEEQRWHDFLVAGIAVSALLCFRPLSAAIVFLFATGVIGQRCLAKKPRAIHSLHGLMWLALGAVPGAVLLLLYNQQITGHPLLTPHELFLRPPLQFGLNIPKHLLVNLAGLSVDLFGVPLLSLVPLLVGIYVSRNSAGFKRIFVLLLAYIFAYSGHYYHSLSYGPRHYFELLPLFLLLSARGLRALPRMITSLRISDAMHARTVTAGLCLVAVTICALGHLPPRLKVYEARGDFYDVRWVYQMIDAPSVVFVEKTPMPKLRPYEAGFQLNNVPLSGPVIFVRDLGDQNKEVFAEWPDREAYVLNVPAEQLSRYPATDTSENLDGPVPQRDVPWHKIGKAAPVEF